MKISGEQERLSVPLFLSPLLQPACLLLFAVCLVLAIRLTRHDAHTHWDRHCTNTTEQPSQHAGLYDLGLYKRVQQSPESIKR